MPAATLHAEADKMQRNRNTFIVCQYVAVKYGFLDSMGSNWMKQFLCGGFSKEVS